MKEKHSMKERIIKIKQKQKQKQDIHNFTGTPLQIFLLSLLVNLLITVLSQASFLQALRFLITDPLVFLYNGIIIYAFLAVSLLFQRRLFVLFLISVFWVLIGMTNFIVLLFRPTPFTAIDLLLLTSVISIIPHYLAWYHYILIGLFLITLLAGGIRAYKKFPKAENTVPLLKRAAFLLLLTLSSFGLTHIGTNTGVLSENFGNLAEAFHDYGLPYCFMTSLLNTGIDKPEHYSKDIVEQIVTSSEQGIVIRADDIEELTQPAFSNSILDKLFRKPEEGAEEGAKEDRAAVSRETPNIIMLQLESFFDPYTVTGTEYTTDPIPFFRSLKETYSHGLFTAPAVGAGTANTEFEVITGMNLDFFGPGEYPYKTVLQSKTCESICYNLKNLGYQTHVIHNNIATFYDRHIIFPKLGFDTYTPLEYMYHTETTMNGWVKDAVLTEEIIKAVKASDVPDMVYAISVQGHGSYPQEAVLTDPVVDLTLPEKFSESQYYEMLYFVNQLYETDQFIKELVSYLEQCGEDTILVLFGDHLPSMPFTEEDLTTASLFQTEYVLWSNFEMDQEVQDLEAYQLYSYVFDRAGIHEGLIPKLHQTQSDSELYQEQLKILEYDMLYGNLDCYGGINPHTQTDMAMGVDPISIFSFHLSGDNLTVMGEHYNQYSRICINGEPVKNTLLVNQGVLRAESIELEPGDEITVSQIADDSRVLGTSEVKYYNERKDKTNE